ncbi:MAG: preprotein translocase subunit SecY [Oscillospiraceae bacterium]|nr:preprotein translocase subunit SecY [Oscillospiraceae bacterium]
MLETIRNAWKVEETRKKLLYTLLIIVIFRIGSILVPAPFLDVQKLAEWMNQNSDNNALGYLNMFSGGAMGKATVFALSIQPFINASIIVQLLTYALPPLERLSKEGEEGRKKIDKISSVVSLVLAVFMAFAYYLTMKNAGALTYRSGFDGIFAMIVIIAVFITGAMAVVWLGNRVNEKGIGNGVSILIFTGIIANGPSGIMSLIEAAKNKPNPYVFVDLFVLIFFVFIVGFIVFMNESERRIPIQYAKRVVGRKQYGGQSTHIPVKVCMSGVMPIIFANAFVSLPMTIALFFPPNTTGTSWWDKFYAGFTRVFSYRSPVYAIVLFFLIIGFNYFYVSMQYNPVEIANNLRQSNGGIPGIRPGKPTSDYIQRVLSKITLVGAVFLGIIAVIPSIFGAVFPDLGNLALGGTSILIVVSVALETVRTLESQIMMRHHKGFLE